MEVSIPPSLTGLCSFSSPTRDSLSSSHVYGMSLLSFFGTRVSSTRSLRDQRLKLGDGPGRYKGRKSGIKE